MLRSWGGPVEEQASGAPPRIAPSDTKQITGWPVTWRWGCARCAPRSPTGPINASCFIQDVDPDCRAGPAQVPQIRQIVGEALANAVKRDGGFGFRLMRGLSRGLGARLAFRSGSESLRASLTRRQLC